MKGGNLNEMWFWTEVIVFDSPQGRIDLPGVCKSHMTVLAVSGASAKPRGGRSKKD